MRFKVGDKVRCVRPWESWLRNEESRGIWMRIRDAEAIVDDPRCQNVEGKDAVGVTVFGKKYAMPEWGLQPIIGPDEKSWEHFQSLTDLQDFEIKAPAPQVVTLGDGA